ncbi:hypothetical protein RKE29_27430 [Streptomyces sp. B1866]|uniref:hypothetical protein n=1 Tax=Streptomyces sp. B1866 TaxID=3075431 RepID=UPI00288F196B|nr:hypothetical protein [Streptomyces sp. B1866]MDT3400301.1 hypothetical protein [Streptomyces sp. B1866]
MDIFDAVRRLGLPTGHYVVFGGAPLMAHGIRETTDIDLFVTSTLYEALKADGWEEKGSGGSRHLARGVFEVFDTWDYGDYNPAPEDIIAAAETIDGVPFAPLTEVLKWKKAFGRPKDAADVELIEHHLRGIA